MEVEELEDEVAAIEILELEVATLEDGNCKFSSKLLSCIQSCEIYSNL